MSWLLLYVCICAAEKFTELISNSNVWHYNVRNKVPLCSVNMVEVRITPGPCDWDIFLVWKHLISRYFEYKSWFRKLTSTSPTKINSLFPKYAVSILCLLIIWVNFSICIIQKENILLLRCCGLWLIEDWFTRA